MDMLLPLAGLMFFFLILSLVVAITSASRDSNNAEDREGKQTKVSRFARQPTEERLKEAA